MRLDTAKAVYEALQSLRGESVLRKLEFLEESQWLRREEIEAIQFEKLKNMLIYAVENVPYYKRVFGAYKDIINDFRAIREMGNFPLLTKHEIQSNYHLMESSNFNGKASVESTSGSTGDPLKFKLDRNMSSFMRALSYREHRWYGLDIGTKEARFYGMPMDFIPIAREWIKDVLMNRRRYSVFDLSNKRLFDYYQKITKFQPEYIYGYTSSVYEFVKYLHDNNIRFKKPFLKAIIATSEVLYQEDKIFMENWMEVPVVNEYGTSELGIIAAQCPQGNMHISSENVFIEIINNDSNVNGDGRGEVILTGLNNYVMPLIRYRVGDVALLSNDCCSCGRGLPLLKQIEGRVNNMVVTPEGKVSSGFLFYYISRSLIERNGGIKKYRVIQNSPDNITFQIVKGMNFEDKNLAILEKKTHEYLSSKINVKFEFYENLESTRNGKSMHFISRINSQMME